MAPLYLAGSILGAAWRWLRGDYKTSGGRIALLLKAITWGLLYLIHRRNVGSEPYFDGPLRETLGDDYEAVAEESHPIGRRRLTRIFPNELLRRRYVEKADIVRYGPHPRVNLADIWRRRDLPRDGKAPVLLQVPGGAWSIGMRRPQAYPHAEPFRRTRVGLRVDRLPGQSRAHVAGPHRRRQACAGLDQGAHRRVRRRPRLRRDHRRFGRRPSLRAGGPDPR